jgi:hypothetical protein
MLDELKKYIQDYKFNMSMAWDEAQRGIEIPDDEHFESDDWYEGTLDTCDLILDKLEELQNA